ncbi:hypothetical protein LIER_16996 [Lithospermum erythrorhizon]|uniref:CCHC-type domain-containing protein n=1 Tax=Lithospermum erythrorhizon TaxID=34254 RepID=A0AAV3QCT5_LITER
MSSSGSSSHPDLSKLEPLDETPPIVALVKKNEDDVVKYEKDNKTARYHILNHMVDNLFDLFMIHKSAKVICEALEKKYGAADAGKKKYVVGKWLSFKMVDGTPIMDQVHVFENLCTDVTNEGMELDEVFLANVLLEKFPSSWSEYRNRLKHKKRDMPLKELISHMRTEEANRLKDKTDKVTPYFSTNANLVETGGPSNGSSYVNRFKGNTKIKQQNWQSKKPNQNKFPRSDGKIQKHLGVVCYACGKTGHKAYQCKSRPQKQVGQKTPQAHLAVSDDVIAAVVVEANLVANAYDWVLNTGASMQICANKEMFQDFEEVADGDYVYMDNSTTAGITVKGRCLSSSPLERPLL